MSIGLMCLSYFDMQPQDITTFPILFDVIKKTISNPYILGNIFWVIWCILFDPTYKPKNKTLRGVKNKNK